MEVGENKGEYRERLLSGLSQGLPPGTGCGDFPLSRKLASPLLSLSKRARSLKASTGCNPF